MFLNAIPTRSSYSVHFLLETTSRSKSFGENKANLDFYVAEQRLKFE